MKGRIAARLAAAGLALAAAALGAHLGGSTIAMIDPVHFQGPALHPRERGVAIEEEAVQPARPAFASLYGWTDGAAARAEDCGGCDAVAAMEMDPAPEPAAEAPARAAAPQAIDRHWSATSRPAPPAAAEPAPAAPTPQPMPAATPAGEVVHYVIEYGRVERYTRYPITAKAADNSGLPGDRDGFLVEVAPGE